MLAPNVENLSQRKPKVSKKQEKQVKIVVVAGVLNVCDEAHKMQFMVRNFSVII